MTMMKRIIAAFTLLGVVALSYSGYVQAAERFKPFVLASQGPGDFDAKVQETKNALSAAGFEIIGEYTPYEDTFVDKAHVIIVTNDELKKAAGMSKYGGFAAPWRVAVTKVGDDIQVAYANPVYIANAYRLKTDLSGVTQGLRKAIGAQQSFGSKKGLSARKLRKYHYTFGMEYFDDVYQLAEYGSHQQAVDNKSRRILRNDNGLSQGFAEVLTGFKGFIAGSNGLNDFQ